MAEKEEKEAVESEIDLLEGSIEGGGGDFLDALGEITSGIQDSNRRKFIAVIDPSQRILLAANMVLADEFDDDIRRDFCHNFLELSPSIGGRHRADVRDMVMGAGKGSPKKKGILQKLGLKGSD